MFEIHLGVPEMEELWKSLQKRHQDGTATDLCNDMLDGAVKTG